MMKISSQRRPIEEFARDASITILLAFALIEIISFAQLSPSLTSGLPYPASLATSSLVVVFSILGIYGLVTRNFIGVFFAFLNSAWEVVLGGSSLIGGFQGNSQLMLSIPALASMMLGAISSLCTFRFSRLLKKPGSGQLYLSSSACDSSSTEYAIEAIDLVKKYFVGPVVVPAINGLTLNVKKGEFISIMGPSGCGKSTLLNLIGALDKPTSGKILIDGVDISTLDENALANLRNEKVGFIFQAYNLINRSAVFRNVELPTLVRGLPKEERERRVKDMLEIVGLLDKAYRKPRMLSGGEQQRVAIARALINKPSIILADEPTGNLDSKTGKDIISFMRKLNREIGTTIIVVTHAREVSEVADRIVYLRDGRIIKEEIRSATQNED